MGAERPADPRPARAGCAEAGFALYAAADLPTPCAGARSLGGEGVVLLSPGAPSFGAYQRLHRARPPFRRAGGFRSRCHQRHPGPWHRLSASRHGHNARAAYAPRRPAASHQGDRHRRCDRSACCRRCCLACPAFAACRPSRSNGRSARQAFSGVPGLRRRQQRQAPGLGDGAGLEGRDATPRSTRPRRSPATNT